LTLPVVIEHQPGDHFDEFAFIEEIAAEVGIASDAAMQARRIAVEVAPGQHVSVIVWGDGPPEIAFMHGGGQNAHAFDSVALLLGRPCISIDLPGQGHSTWKADKEYWPNTNADAVATVLKQLAPNPLVIVGMSLGGLTGIRLAAVRPDLVTHLIVVDVTPDVMNQAINLTPEQRGIGALLQGPREFEFEEMLAIAVKASPSGNAAKLRRGLLFNAKPLGDGRWTWRYDALRFPDSPPNDHSHLWADLAQVTAPTMLVRGSRSHHVTHVDEARFREIRPGARVEMVAGASHSVQGSKPLELAELITDFAFTAT
jgi:esterase